MEETLVNLVRNDDLDTLKEYMKLGVDINKQDSDKRTALMEACRDTNSSMFKYIMKQKPDIHLEDDLGYTALHWAVYGGNYGMVAELIKKGADVNNGDARKSSPLVLGLFNSAKDKMMKELYNGNPDFSKIVSPDGSFIDLINSKYSQYKDGFEKHNKKKRIGVFADLLD